MIPGSSARRAVAILLLGALIVQATSVQDLLTDRLNRFAHVYNAFIIECHNGIFDTRAAKRLSKMWRQIEDSGSWPK